MVRIIVLAAGKGKRMGSSDLPKVLRPLTGKPLLAYVLAAIEDSGVDPHPTLVVGHLAEKVREVCGDVCDYALQTELRGTGDAVRSARPLLEGKADHVLVLNGDHPLVTGRLIRSIADAHLASGATLTIGTVRVPDFEGWRAPFADFGRITRDADGNVDGIVEKKDATPEQLAIMEVNPTFFCFKAAWLWPALETLTTENAQREYYLTALLAKAVEGGEPVRAVAVPSEESVGVNTPEQLEMAEKMLEERKHPR